MIFFVGFQLGKGVKRPKFALYHPARTKKTISLFGKLIFSSNMQLDVYLFPLHLGPRLPRLWTENDATRRDGWFSKKQNCLFLFQKYTLTVFVQVDLPNIETGSPHMSGTVRDKIFVGQVSRKRNARECQEWCQVNKPEHQDVDALGET